jgi:hypothetical protein
MNDRACVIMEERRNPPIGEQRAVTMWRRKDIHRDNPVTMEERKSLMGEQETATIIEVTCRGAVCCHYKGQERRRIYFIGEQMLPSEYCFSFKTVTVKNRSA